MSNANFASASKPLTIGGGIWVAPVGTPLPTSTTDQLNEDFESLGYISADGVKRNISNSPKKHKAWGGAVVAVTDEGKEETLKFVTIDAGNAKAQELAYGEATGSLSVGMTVKSTSGPRPTNSYVIDMLMKDNVRKRLVVPQGMVTEVGVTTYGDNDLLGSDMTVTAMADSDGVTVYDYTKAPAASTQSGGNAETTGTETDGEGGGNG